MENITPELIDFPELPPALNYLQMPAAPAASTVDFWHASRAA
jgi:hypothetical protein